ncbi:pentatricopeptide repeat-containing protein At5g66520 isoform X2 [Cryptomeria japonica]|uniref:pentatricopeptide repeat-containing protein At5g66520 isoform X2 n=1 Tax=Cryptomeria japonica TaxID=3369 RepID=UPI0027DAAB0B|nr:pentatricopeptide repeat-containing protein At5g66520 isoform X2 [Cryptomeria japonica]
MQSIPSTGKIYKLKTILAKTSFSISRDTLKQIPTNNNNPIDYAALLQACNDLITLRQLHAKILIAGLEHDYFLGTKLLSFYGLYGRVDNARQVFDKIPHRDIYLWNVIIRACAKNGLCRESLELYHQMQEHGVRPNEFTFPSVVKACAELLALEEGKGCSSLLALKEGKGIHDQIVRFGLCSNIFIGAALIDMYVKLGSLEDARHVFDKIPHKDVVSWTALIAGYAQNGGDATEALVLFHQMQQDGVVSDPIAAMSALHACSRLGNLEQGYAQNGYGTEALEMFDQMKMTEVEPNSSTMVSVLLACAHLGALQQGKQFHDYIIRSGFDSSVLVGTSLVDMYCKCGRVDIARQVFDKMPERNVISWSAMIAGYGMHGLGEDAVALFSQMQQTDLKPDHVTFVSLLSACSHAGLVKEGWQFFECMRRDYCILPVEKHYACMVDLLGRAGCLDEAKELIREMPLKPNAGVWGALLGACRIHGDIKLGELAAEHLFELEPQNSGVFILLSNIYAAAGKWDAAAKVRKMMKERRVKKTPGCSLIEMNHKVHAFCTGDRSHPQSEQIYAMLETLSRQMEEAGYAPDTNFVLHDLEEEVKERMLYSHSEKLAIAFGIINTSPGTPIHIIKNLRVCGDCHIASKFISKIVKREIIVRDVNRFHHFKDGLCSCRDYW